MFKEVIRGMDTDLFAIVGLVAFIAAFILIMVRVVLMKKSDRIEMKNMPLDDSDDQRPQQP